MSKRHLTLNDFKKQLKPVIIISQLMQSKKLSQSDQIKRFVIENTHLWLEVVELKDFVAWIGDFSWVKARTDNFWILTIIVMTTGPEKLDCFPNTKIMLYL